MAHSRLLLIHGTDDGRPRRLCSSGLASCRHLVDSVHSCMYECKCKGISPSDSPQKKRESREPQPYPAGSPHVSLCAEGYVGLWRAPATCVCVCVKQALGKKHASKCKFVP